MMEREKYNCPVEAALSQFEGKYKAIILQGRGDALQ